MWPWRNRTLAVLCPPVGRLARNTPAAIALAGPTAITLADLLAITLADLAPVTPPGL